MLQNGLCLLLVLLTLASCKENGKQKNIQEALKKRNTVNNVSIEARFIKESKGAGEMYSLAHESYLYFNIRLNQPNLEPDLKTTEYLNFKMNEDFRMLSREDTLLPLIVHRVNNGIKDSYEYLVAFDRAQDFDHSGKVSILYQDKIFGIGDQVFEFRVEDILK